jgi:hypothetical protein
MAAKLRVRRLRMPGTLARPVHPARIQHIKRTPPKPRFFRGISAPAFCSIHSLAEMFLVIQIRLLSVDRCFFSSIFSVVLSFREFLFSFQNNFLNVQKSMDKFLNPVFVKKLFNEDRARVACGVVCIFLEPAGSTRHKNTQNSQPCNRRSKWERATDWPAGRRGYLKRGLSGRSESSVQRLGWYCLRLRYLYCVAIRTPSLQTVRHWSPCRRAPVGITHGY